MNADVAPAVGKAVVYYTSRRLPLPALMTARWSDSCMNVVMLSQDEKAVDPHGRQLIRQTSVVHISWNDAKACCWGSLENAFQFDDLVLFDHEGTSLPALVTKRLEDGTLNLVTIADSTERYDDHGYPQGEEENWDDYGFKVVRHLGIDAEEVKPYQA